MRVRYWVPRGLQLLAGFGLAFGFNPVHAQQAPLGQEAVALTQPSYVFDTAEQHKVRVVVVVRGLRHPFAVALLPDGDALVSERGGALRLVHGAAGEAAQLDPKPIDGLPAAPAYRNGGLQDVALHPDFARNHWVYFTFNQAGNPPPADAKPPVRQESRVSLFRGELVGHALTHVQQLFVGGSGSTSGSRLAFDGHGMVYMTTGGPFDDAAQRLDTVYGKVLRLKDDGSIPQDNPFVGRAGARGEIFSIGHRDHLGLTVSPTGVVLNAEEGPNGGDKLNVILPGHNYGWPKVSFGRDYAGPRISESPVAPGIDQPLVVWLPSIAPGGLTFYTGDKFPAWAGNVFVTSARRGEIPRTGGLERVVFNAKLEELRRETLFTELHQRFRDVRQGPDGLLYAVTDEDDAALLRIEPAAATAAATSLPVSAATGAAVAGAAPEAQSPEPQIRLTPQDIQSLAAQARSNPARRGPASIDLNGDPSKPGVYTVQVTLPAHTTVPPHTHRDNRAVYVVSGTLYVGYGQKRDAAALKTLPPGSYYTEPAATPHYTETHDDPVVIVITGMGPSDTHLLGAMPPVAK
ncbi:MAG TPA: PQQ-dependent sugar dehydrogenase [Steroidobacteraceae bacterium]|jgi:glucose/arabinose dehydrogenase/quercetin dioxygenase-like cupin family protein